MNQYILLSLICSLMILAESKIQEMGYINAEEEVQLFLNSTYDQDGYEYKFMTNYKKVYFNLVTTPSSSDKFKQRMILSSNPFDRGPHKCTEGNNYGHSVSNRIYSETQVMYSKCFPTLFIYIINQPISGSSFIENENKNDHIQNISDELTNSILKLAGIDDGDDQLAEAPVFTLTPKHLEQDGVMISTDLMPRCASLGNQQGVDPAFCTTDCILLTCQSSSGENLFSLGAAKTISVEEMDLICQAHFQYEGNTVMTNGIDPIPYEPSLSQTSASIFLAVLFLLGFMITGIFVYNIRLLKTGDVPGDFGSFCPEGLFPHKLEDNPLYKEEKMDD